MHRKRLAIKTNCNLRDSRLLFDTQIHDSVNSRHGIANLFSCVMQHIKVGTEYFHRDGRRRSGENLFDPFRDELFNSEREAGDVFQLRPDIGHHGVAVPITLFQLHDQFSEIWSHRVFTEFCPSCLLRSLYRLRDFLHTRLHDAANTHRLRHGGSRQACHVDDQIAFVEFGKKFTTEKRNGGDRRSQQHD